MEKLNFIINRCWTVGSVRKACIDNDFFTLGDNEEYGHMLLLVSRLYPNTENLYSIAKMIEKYSEDQTIANIMTILEKEAITTIYEIEYK